MEWKTEPVVEQFRIKTLDNIDLVGCVPFSFPHSTFATGKRGGKSIFKKNCVWVNGLTMVYVLKHVPYYLNSP